MTIPTPPPSGARPPSATLSDRSLATLLLDSSPWLSCEECFEHLDRYAEAVVAGRPTDPTFAVHLLACPACAEEAESMVDLLGDLVG